MSTVGERVKALIKHSRLTQEKFADKIGSSRGYVSLIVNDHEPITMGILEKLLNLYPMLNLNWLMFGDGYMFRQKEVEEKLDVVEEKQEEYQPGGWVQELSGLLDRHEERIGRLEEEVANLKEFINSKK